MQTGLGRTKYIVLHIIHQIRTIRTVGAVFSTVNTLPPILWRQVVPSAGEFGTNYSALVISKVNKSTLDESNYNLEVMTEAAETKKEEAEGKKVVHTYPLVRHCDMIDEMKTEAMELCVTACEKHAANNENAARMIKEAMDRKFGPSWHVVVGEGYGFEISYECRHLLYMFFGGNMAICTWKCS